MTRLTKFTFLMLTTVLVFSGCSTERLFTKQQLDAKRMRYARTASSESQNAEKNVGPLKKSRIESQEISEAGTLPPADVFVQEDLVDRTVEPAEAITTQRVSTSKDLTPYIVSPEVPSDTNVRKGGDDEVGLYAWRTQRYATSALAFAFLGWLPFSPFVGSVFGIVFGILAIRNYFWYGGARKDLNKAIAGIVISVVTLLVLAALLLAFVL